MKKDSISLSTWVDRLQRSGRYAFTRSGAERSLGLSETSLDKALQRLCRRGRILRPRKGFYVLIPLEYSAAGTVPPEWFIGDLMAFIGKPYYVGCLSAAALYGAAHQRPQELEVVVPSYERAIDNPAVRIRFLQYSGMSKALIRRHRTHTGDYPVSSPEWTAIDLIRFQKHLGGLDAVATVLAELGESLDGGRLLEAARRESVNAVLQRLGWMLDSAGFTGLTMALREYIASRKSRVVLLNPAAKDRRRFRNRRWDVWVNEKPRSEL